MKVSNEVLQYKRENELSSSEINPLLIIRAPRHIPKAIKYYNGLTFIDKLWMFHIPFNVIDIVVMNEIRKREEYTHIIISSDDVTFKPDVFKLLLHDLRIYDFPVLSGCCNYCNVWETEDLTCTYCKENLPHKYINVTLEELNVGKYPTIKSYKWLTDEWRRKHQGIMKVKFQGFSPVIIRRDVFDRVKLRPFSDKMFADDVTFSIDCIKCGIPQFCDFRAFMRHWGIYHKGIKSITKRPKIIFEPKNSRNT